MKNRKEFINAIITVMSTDDALVRGIHIDMITDRLVMCGLPVVSGCSYEELHDLANRIILADCRRGGKYFSKVVNAKNGSARRGVYRLSLDK